MVSNKNRKIKVDFDRVFLRPSINDELPRKFIDKKLLKRLERLPFLQRNELIQNALALKNQRIREQRKKRK